MKYDYSSYIGKIYGNLEIIAIGETNKHRKKVLIVKCLKHPDVEPWGVVKQSLVNGSTVGCFKCKKERNQTHGKSKTRTYHVYKRMIARVLNPDDKDYVNYGGRGIDLDPRYDPNYNEQGLEKSFLNFYNDIGNIVDDLTLDRIDNSKGYWKDNLRLVNITEQQRNKRNNVVNINIVENIRSDYKTGNYTYQQLANKYNLKMREIDRILNYKIWA